MPKLPRDLSPDQVIRAFKRAGWQKRPTKKKGAKHTVLVRPGAETILPIPRHRTVKTGTLRSLIDHAGLTVDEFIQLLK